MAPSKIAMTKQSSQPDRRFAIGLVAVFVTQFVSYLLINARNIANPVMIAEFDGMALFPWLIALPALSGAIGTLLSGKLSDMYGRRAVLLSAILIFALGLLLMAFSRSMVFTIAAHTFMSLGHFPIVPLCFAVIGDLFGATERAKWTGLLNISTSAAALVGPTLGGFVTESALGWRAVFWGTVPLLVLAGSLVAVGVAGRQQRAKQQVDVIGIVGMVIAVSTLMFGVAWLGQPDSFRWSLILLPISALAWAGFIYVEKRAEAPILDPQVLFNRTFMTAAGSGLLGMFGMLSIMAYSPIFAQEVMAVSPTTSGSILTPYIVIVAVMGIVAGFLLARTKRYRWMYNSSYLVVLLSMLVMWRFTAATPIWLYILVTGIAGLGLGAIPTVNTLVAQYAVPKRLLGVAVGAIFFFQMLGLTVAPAILGLAQNSTPDLESGLARVFLVSAIATGVALLLILTIPAIAIDTEVAEPKPRA
ncbi:MAG: MFS transporter [Anaerolineales bacterium]|nr:MFS transporter [Anaerolineales bacterium]